MSLLKQTSVWHRDFSPRRRVGRRGAIRNWAVERKAARPPVFCECERGTNDAPRAAMPQAVMCSSSTSRNRAEPGGMGGPSRTGDQFSIYHRTEGVHRDKGSAGQLHLGRASRIGIELAVLEDAGRGQQLGSVAEGGDGLLARSKERTISSTLGLRRRYSGARPPGTTRASYCAGSTSSKWH